jgi:hypothetical protein
MIFLAGKGEHKTVREERGRFLFPLAAWDSREL